ncbi:MAG TPA: 2,3-bisphosphoglycerate-independent phosphoglycerate mutase [Pyrinomonadaceae bacterium]|nr:2,3-bisphosphoglycerate-independent phosphoglycerate mutase [Pyrinomonadaceae bacterium]
MSYQTRPPLALIILDGWGISGTSAGNALAQAHTPYYNEICRRFPSCALQASGESVGLPTHTPGNAEVGHRTIGAGRVVKTTRAHLEESLANGEFARNRVLESAIKNAAARGTAVHLVGLLSDGGVHSSPESLFALLRMAKAAGVKEVFVHAILDGRDVDQRTADIYVEALEIKMVDIGIGKISTLCGRFYSMDEGGKWERTARAFTMMVHGEGERSFDAATAIRASFLRGISDEFIAPIVIESSAGQPLGVIREGDVVIFFNHVAAPMRQLVRSLAVSDAATPKPKVEAVCMTEYDPAFGLPFAIAEEAGQNLFPHVLDHCGIKNYRITESVRASHVSAVFNGGDGTASSLETDIFVQTVQESLLSEPESRSFKIADAAIESIAADPSGIFIVNLPAADLLAAYGSIEKTVEAVQFVDTCLGGLVEKIVETNGVALITSSHSGCEDLNGVGRGPVGAGGSMNPVPLHLVHSQEPTRSLSDGSLTDVAPTMLGILGLKIPAEMSGRDLRL